MNRIRDREFQAYEWDPLQNPLGKKRPPFDSLGSLLAGNECPGVEQS